MQKLISKGGGAGAGSDVWKRERKDSPSMFFFSSRGESWARNSYHPTCVKLATSSFLFAQMLLYLSMERNKGVSIY